MHVAAPSVRQMAVEIHRCPLRVRPTEAFGQKLRYREKRLCGRTLCS